VTFELTANAGELVSEMPDCNVETSEAATAACDLGADEELGVGGVPVEE
jgi:hypothetical protein